MIIYDINVHSISKSVTLLMTDTKCIQPTELLHPAQLKLLLIKCYRRNAAELQFTRGPGA